MKENSHANVQGTRRQVEDARNDEELRERAIAVGSGVSEAVGFIDDKKAARGGRGRQGAVRRRTQGLMRDDRGVGVVPLQQAAPLVRQHRWHDQREWLAEREADRERDVRLAEPYGVRE